MEGLIELIQAAGISWALASQQIEVLTPFAVETRYPGGLGQISRAECEAAINSAAAVFQWASMETENPN